MVYSRQELEQQIQSWSTISDLPPLNEVEVLRSIDDVLQDENSSEFNLAGLYTMLAFYRLRRNYKSDQVTDTLLKDAVSFDAYPDVLPDLIKIKSFFTFYTVLNRVPFSEWTIRETDYDPAKIKKAKELSSEVHDLIEKGNKISSGSVEDLQNKQLAADFNELMKLLHALSQTLSETIEDLDNRRTDIPIKDLNQLVKEIITLQASFYDKLPKVFKSASGYSPLEKLDEMVGLKDIKKYIHQYYHYLKYQKERKELGFHMVDEPGLHMIITGNPGTGKTAIARLLASIYYELGLLETSSVTEVNRSNLVGSYVGQSEENTVGYVKEAIGGTLFIDEAYSLKREGQSGNDYGQSVIDTLVSSMTNKEFGDRFALFLAGYPEEMRQFLWSNPGLRSRFPEQNHIALPDFNIGELVQIAEITALSNDYFFTEKALTKLKDLIEDSRVDESFGNGRTVRDLVLKAIFKKGASKSGDSVDNWLDHMKLDFNDLSFHEEENQDQDPVTQLDQLIGLANVKEEVKKLSAFVRIQQERKLKGFPPVPVQLHAVFSGNPGTGKTTVANIYSRILRECGLLKRGHLVVASRSDLVAGYVGQTAIKTKRKIREALGGVLFIDEAYSLNRGAKDFGKEAIDTLVDEMTKHNENLVVILAGYKQEMRQFIASNPGLESRFKKYFDFKDYSQDELVEITNYHIDKYQYEIDKKAVNYLRKQFDETRIEGNARFVINLIDEAIQFQALRMEENQTDIIASFQFLLKEDFQRAWSNLRGNKE